MENKKFELNDEALDVVSGGYWGDEYAPNCPNCNLKMRVVYINTFPVYNCGSCGHVIEIEP